ncbi:TIR domain-containing protein [Lyngbya aestuarii]|uniref:TIR domain-containing protein n=1 Tax=Lyngbya aestuarii TaxID=118322 RepID=UPI00403DB1B5
MTTFFDVFISYGRADSKAFATKLHQRLTALGLKVWFDQNDIPPAVDWQQQIDDGIERTHNFIFIVAPHAVNSVYCLKEIELALKYNKRIIPLVHIKSDRDKIHPTIRKLNWIYFQEDIDDFEASFAQLINTLNHQTDYVKQHTQFLIKALEWERHQKRTSYLLIGEEKQQSQSWLKRRFKYEQPPCVPNDLHCEYITESIKKDEVEYAAELNKRFVTVLHREVNTADLHPALDKVQWIDFNHNERDFNDNFKQLVRTLDTDREHLRNHTKWLHRAIAPSATGSELKNSRTHIITFSLTFHLSQGRLLYSLTQG